MSCHIHEFMELWSAASRQHWSLECAARGRLTLFNRYIMLPPCICAVGGLRRAEIKKTFFSHDSENAMLLLSKCILGGAGPNTQNSERIFGRSESCAYRPAVDLVEKLRMAMKKPCKGCEAQLNYYRLNPSIKWSHEESDCDSQLRLSAAWHWMSAAAEKRSLILLKANTMWLKCCNRWHAASLEAFVWAIVICCDVTLSKCQWAAWLCCNAFSANPLLSILLSRMLFEMLQRLRELTCTLCEFQMQLGPRSIFFHARIKLTYVLHWTHTSQTWLDL